VFPAIFALWALSSAFVVHAADNAWSPIGPDGGYIDRVAFHKTSQNTMYLMATGGFFRSTDGGAHWQQPQPEITALASDFALDPADNNRIYLVLHSGYSRVLVSTDAGATFSTLFWFGKNDSLPTDIEISADGNTLYAVFYDGVVFRSTDRGGSWQQRTSLGIDVPFGPDQVSIDPSDAGTLYVVQNYQLLATHDGAGTWANITPASSSVLDVVVNPTDSNELWAATTSGLNRSSDRGASWSVAQSGYIPTVALDPRVPSTVYTALSWGNVLKRNGGTWSDITSDLGSFSPRAIVVSPHDSATVAVANIRGLWITHNGGGHWARSDAGVASTSISGFAVASDHAYTMGSAVTRLDHGSDVVTEIDLDGLFQLLSYKTSGIDALAPVLESNRGLIVAIGGRIARTLDDGASWNITGYAAAANEAVLHLAATSSAPSVYYASSSSSLQKSMDQGATWTAIGSGLPADRSPGVIAIAPSNPAVIYAGPRTPTYFGTPASGVYKSIDGGDSWTPANTGIEDRVVSAIAVHPTDPNIVYIGTSFQVMKTVNGGATWTTLPWPGAFDGEADAIAIDPSAPETVYVAGSFASSAVARSTDGGATWISLAEPGTFFPWRANALAVDPTRPGTVRVGTGYGAIRQLSIRPELQPDLAIQLTQLSNELPLLAPSALRFTISNVGAGPSDDVLAKIRVSADGAELSVNPSAGTCTIASFAIECVAPALAANATMDIVVTMTPTRGDVPMSIDASVQSNRIDAQSTNNSLSHTTYITERARLAVDIAGPTTVQVGDSVQYTATIASEGPSPASNVTATFFSPAQITRDSFSITAGACWSTGLNTLECQLGTLSPGAVVTLTVNGTVAQAGAHTVYSTASNGRVGDQAGVTTTASAPPAPQPPPPPGNSGSSSGGGGGGGATSPLMLLGLLGLGLFRAQRFPARRSAGRPRVYK
jgi:uncharacterized repeat protein (TIGR01451 family)